MKAPRTCSRDGCTNIHRARGLCNNHYVQWRRTAKLNVTMFDTPGLLLAAMPGTVKELAARCCIQYETARKACAKLRAENKAHIEDHVPPEHHGRPYIAILTAGPGVDAVVTKKQRRENHLLARRKWYHANESKPRFNDPLVAALFGPAPAQRKDNERHQHL